jgi:hypothetical protein
MIMLTGLASVLRAAGSAVVEAPGWQTRGRAWSSKPHGFIAHHTGGGDNVAASVALVRDGRSDLPGPLSQFVLTPAGEWHIIAAGRSNHAGPGRWQGITSGNSEMLGCEAMNRGDGKDVWEIEQMNSYARGAAALAEHFGFPALNVCGHKEWALPKGRKIDPTFDMPAFRTLVADIMDDSDTPAGQLPSAPPVIPTTDPARTMLSRGSQGTDVLELQNRLRTLGYKVAANGIFSWETDTRVREFQRDHRLTVDGQVGPKTWAALGI